jgi:predicted acylesterase/phospholipase RssA
LEPVRTRLDRVAGRPPSTVSRALVAWLADTLDELSGVSSKMVLRFGHLWSPWYADCVTPLPAELSTEARRRSINLELITTELVKGVPYRFPLRPWEQQRGSRSLLYFDPRDLNEGDRQVVPERVIEAMKAGRAHGVKALDVGNGREVELWPLPAAADLPVVFAARLSLSLPGVFEAVRLYRRVESVTVRDELGRRLTAGGADLEYPPAPDDRFWVEQLWFSDGGITSNFPIHFFDAPLPLWPTFGINLTGYPAGFGHQDVWLPQDWDGGEGDSRPLNGSATGFLGAIVSTARGWRDTVQSLMPAYRGRVAAVRQGPKEGGVNLFMTPATIAGMGLRGVLAGARLRRRFDPHGHRLSNGATAARHWWRRHQWMRLRIAAHNMHQVRRDLRMAARDPVFGALTDAATGPAELTAMQDDATCPGDAELVRPGRWFGPVGDVEPFWEGMRAVGAARDGGPYVKLEDADRLWPAPDLRQVPPL